MKFGRVTINLPERFENDLEELKKKKFYDKSLSELIRYLIDLGIKEEKENNKYQK